MFDRASIVRPLGRCRIVAGEVNRDGKRVARRAAPAYTRSVHVHRAAEPSSPGLSPLRAVHTFEQPIRWRVYSSTSLPRDGSSAPRAEVRLTFFRVAVNLPIHLCIPSRNSLRLAGLIM